jgi:aconitate hydratase
MAQKILATRSSEAEAAIARDFIEVHVDQIVVVRTAARVHAEAVQAGLRKTGAEVAIAYDGACVGGERSGAGEPAAAEELLAHGVLLGRAGVGFPAPVHLERFASPARLCVTDDARLAGVGGIGMLTLVVPTPSLAQALVRGTVSVRTPVSVQVLLGGRLRPFVCASDAALELIRRGIGDVVRRVEEARGAPVVLEFAGPSARALSVAERSVLAGIAPLVGAAGALFVSDERTEVFLRDQRRSKAHRALAPDAGAPCEEVVSVDLGAVDPLLLDPQGVVRAVRDMVSQPVSQVLLGGDRGVTLRDLFAVATLLKSKRVPPRLDFLLAIPSRQMLEVLSRAGALTDLIATGARLIEPDARVTSGELYAPTRPGLALSTCDPEAAVPGQRSSIMASAETLAYAVATGEIGDPRSFKRPVRITVPRARPTDDVLVARKSGRADPPGRSARREPPASAALLASPGALPPKAWQGQLTLELVACSAFAASLATPSSEAGVHPAIGVVCSTLDEVRWLCDRTSPARAAHAWAPAGPAGAVRAVLAPFIPSLLVSLFSAAGIAALRVEPSTAKALKGLPSLALPGPAQWASGEPTSVRGSAGALLLTWLALGRERDWVARGPSPGASAPGAQGAGVTVAGASGGGAADTAAGSAGKRADQAGDRAADRAASRARRAAMMV